MTKPNLWGAVLLSAILAAAVWCVPFVPTHDGPNHLASCFLAKALADGASPLHRYLEPNVPISALAYHALCSSLAGIFDFEEAHRISVFAMGLVFALGYLFLGTAIAPRSAFHLFGFALALPWVFYMGFYNFYLATGLSLWLLGYVARRKRLARAEWWAVSLSLLVLAAGHVFAALVAGILIASYLVLTSDRRGRTCLHVLLAGAPSGMLAIASFLVYRTMDVFDGDQAEASTEWHTLARRIVDLAETFAGGDPIRAWGLAGVTVSATAMSTVPWVRRRLAMEARWIAAVSMASLAGFLLAPFSLGRWDYFSARIILLGQAIAPLALPIDALGSAWGRIVRASVLTVSAASLLWSAGYHLELDRHVAPILAGLTAPVTRTGARLPVILADPPSRFAHAKPASALGHLYILAQGGVDPYVWADLWPIDPIRFKARPNELFGSHPLRYAAGKLECAGRALDCPPLEAQYEWFALWGRRFEDVILYSEDPRAHAIFEARGYRSEHKAGALSLLVPGTCELRLAVERGALPPDRNFDLTLEVGRRGLESPVIRDTLGPTVAIPEDDLELDVRGPDCGDLWVFLGTPAPSAREARYVCASTSTAAPMEGDRMVVRAAPHAPVRITCRF